MSDKQKIDDGGSAFPLTEACVHGLPTGMSLHDWFAGQPGMSFDDHASPGWVAGQLDLPYDELEFSRLTPHERFLWCRRAEAAWRYANADAMIQARKEQA